MNKRIRELAIKANAKVIGDQFKYMKMYEDDIEKFAELIIEECIAQCWSVSELEHNGYVVSECSKRVRKHFGVEE